MAFFPPIPLIRRNVIIRKLKASGATSEETAKTLIEAGVSKTCECGMNHW